MVANPIYKHKDNKELSIPAKSLFKDIVSKNPKLKLIQLGGLDKLGNTTKNGNKVKFICAVFEISKSIKIVDFGMSSSSTLNNLSNQPPTDQITTIEPQSQSSNATAIESPDESNSTGYMNINGPVIDGEITNEEMLEFQALVPGVARSNYIYNFPKE